MAFLKGCYTTVKQVGRVVTFSTLIQHFYCPPIHYKCIIDFYYSQKVCEFSVPSHLVHQAYNVVEGWTIADYIRYYSQIPSNAMQVGFYVSAKDSC